MSILQLVEKCTPQEWQVPLDVSPLPDQGSDKGLWIDPVTLLTVLNGWALAVWAMGLAQPGTGAQSAGDPGGLSGVGRGH